MSASSEHAAAGYRSCYLCGESILPGEYWTQEPPRYEWCHQECNRTMHEDRMREEQRTVPMSKDVATGIDERRAR